MSASTPPVGIDHPTVVPANFEPERRDGESATDAEDGEPAADADGDES